ncbi:MAG: RNA polymerase sigma factor [bacterium]
MKSEMIRVGVEERYYEYLIRPIEDQMIRSVWRIVQNPEDADDAFQDALATIWKRLAKIRRHPNPRALILKICVNSAYDTLRRKIRRRSRETPEGIPAGIPDSSPSAWDKLLGKEQRAEILCAIGRLSRNQAQAVLMRIVEEQPYSSIAQALGCSEATARTHVTRARTRLCKLLSHLAPHLAEEAIP